MPELVRIEATEGFRLSDLEGEVRALDAQLLARHAPESHWMLLDRRRLLARCSTWWRSTPRLDGNRVGAVGHYAAADAASGARVIEAACDELRRAGTALAVGPMDGNTWRSYRFVTDRGDAPPFLLEPWQPPEWPAHFGACGFEPLASYHSALCEDLSEPDPRAAAACARLARNGVAIRPLKLDEFEAELKRIHALSAVSFAGNFLYTPLAESDFLQQYVPIRGYVHPGLVLIAECEGEVVGYVFALPDWNEKQRGAEPRTIIVKTVAVAGGRRHAGLGVCLVARVHEAAHAMGYTRAVHALMHDENNSANVSRRYSRVMRRYTLFARNLA
ncbi:MAG TPA: GNAT family N-acetyltransferase [Burkholderiales bacterium]|nr:GNAT family N-acetyltransferase [Burkholderiales bacterium]